MSILIMVLMVVGFMISLVGSILFLVAAFRQSVPWGLAVLLLPFAALVFLFMHWSQAKRAFMVQLLGTLIGILVFILGGRSVVASVKSSIPLPQGPDQLGASFESLTQSAASTWKGDPPATNPASTYVGKTLKEVVDILGEPTASLAADGIVTYFYPKLELVAEDGIHVSFQCVSKEGMERSKPKPDR